MTAVLTPVAGQSMFDHSVTADSLVIFIAVIAALAASCLVTILLRRARR